MKLVQVAEQNKKYYTKEFIHGFNTGAKAQLEADKREAERLGRWLPDNNSVYEMRFICSECKESQVVPTIGFTKYKPLWDYCPICGARMDGEEE